MVDQSAFFKSVENWKIPVTASSLKNTEGTKGTVSKLTNETP